MNAPTGQEDGPGASPGGATGAGGARGAARRRDLDAALEDFRSALTLLEGERRGVRPPTVGNGEALPVDQSCQALLKVLRRRCPQLLPDGPVGAGEAVTPVPVAPDAVARVVVLALQQSAALATTGRVPTLEQLPKGVVWREGADAIVVQLEGMEVELGEGEVVVHFRVHCDQLRGAAGVRVRFVVGTTDRPTGLLAATPTLPDGPEAVVQRWGEALTAYAWRALLDTASGIAGAAGRDADGNPLVATALVASPNGLVVLPQARHRMDRILSRAVR